MNLFEGTQGERVRIALFAVLCVLALLLAVRTIGAVLQLRYIGTGITPTNTIVVSGHGETLQVPDIATFTFAVVSDKPTVTAAQADATAKANTITDYLTSAGVNKNDIQTSDYSVQPQYSYQQGCPPQVNGTVTCPPSRQVLTGYEVRQTTTVKVRDTAKAGDLLANIGQKGATEVSGLTFEFDNPDAPQQAARDKAIVNAKQKAEELAKSLGVSLVRVVAFSENGTTPQPPVAYGLGARAVESAPAAPVISVGQNKVVSDVSITYEIR